MLARELGLGEAEPSSSSSFYAPPAVIAAQRQQLLRELQVAVKKAIQLGMEAPETAMCCDEPAVYELCLALESCLCLSVFGAGSLRWAPTESHGAGTRCRTGGDNTVRRFWGQDRRGSGYI